MDRWWLQNTRSKNSLWQLNMMRFNMISIKEQYVYRSYFLYLFKKKSIAIFSLKKVETRSKRSPDYQLKTNMVAVSNITKKTAFAPRFIWRNMAKRSIWWRKNGYCLARFLAFVSWSHSKYCCKIPRCIIIALYRHRKKTHWNCFEFSSVRWKKYRHCLWYG